MALTGLSSMATRHLLAELAADHASRGGSVLQLESVGGVDAARRVAAGELFDLVFLAADAIGRLAAAGHVLADSGVDYARSPVAVAVRAGAAPPDIGSEDALRRAVLAARSLGYSTGPSGTHMAALFARWGIAEALAPRLVIAPPGVPVASLVASGEIELGFQQLSELMGQPGIAILGPLPDGAQFVTTFSAAVCATSQQPAAARALLVALLAAESADCKRRHGMQPA